MMYIQNKYHHWHHHHHRGPASGTQGRARRSGVHQDAVHCHTRGSPLRAIPRGCAACTQDVCSEMSYRQNVQNAHA